MVLKLSALLLLIFEICHGKYKGESFPVKYLDPEDVMPEYLDGDYYLQGLNKILNYAVKFVNETDDTRAIGVFYMKAILKRTIYENKHKIQAEQQILMNNVITQAEIIMSHFFYQHFRPNTWADAVKRLAELFKDEDLQIQSIGTYNRNRLQKWLLKDVRINDFAKDMDDLKLPKEKYLEYSQESIESDKYNMDIGSSDYCLASIIYNPKPQDTETLKPCVADQYCSEIVYLEAPSFAYSLSHRLWNLIFPRHIRRCYMKSPKKDDELVDILCASMYREAVYIARRGFFNRDLWLEHVTLCALIGYEEFHRRHWFRKVMSWIDKDGCIAENHNYYINRTTYLLANEKDPEKLHIIREARRRGLSCHWHQMSLSLAVLAHGVRHTVHFSDVNRNILKDEL